jgi:hypothetical protein
MIEYVAGPVWNYDAFCFLCMWELIICLWSLPIDLSWYPHNYSSLQPPDVAPGTATSPSMGRRTTPKCQMVWVLHKQNTHCFFFLLMQDTFLNKETFWLWSHLYLHIVFTYCIYILYLHSVRVRVRVRRVSLQEQGWSENLQEGIAPETGLYWKPTGGYRSRNRVVLKTYRKVSLQEQGCTENLQEGISPGTGLYWKPTGGYLSRNRVGVKTYSRVGQGTGLDREQGWTGNRVGVKTYRRVGQGTGLDREQGWTGNRVGQGTGLDREQGWTVLT